MCWALQSMVDRFLCSANRLVRKVFGTGDGCSLENVSSTKSPEAGSRASETRSANMGCFNYIVRGGAQMWQVRMPTQRDTQGFHESPRIEKSIGATASNTVMA